MKSKNYIFFFYQKFILILLACIIFSWQSCVHIRPTTATHYEIKHKNDKKNNYYEAFKFFIHEGEDFYRLKVKTMNDSSIVFNQYYKEKYKEFDENWTDFQKRSYYNDHKYDVVIYLKENIKITEHYELDENNVCQLFQTEIDKIVIYEKFTNQTSTAVTMTTVVILGGVLLMGLLLILLGIIGIGIEILNFISG